MQVSVEATEGLERRMTIGVGAERIDTEVDKRLKKLAHTVKLNGFRAGKVPFKEVSRRFYPQVRDEVVHAVLESSFKEALDQESLEPVASPDIKMLRNLIGEELQYTATFEVFPEVTIDPEHTVSATQLQADITDADVENALEKVRREKASWVDVERAAAVGDKLTIDFDVTIEADKPQKETAKAFELELGAKRMIAGFEDGLVGHSIGDEVRLELVNDKAHPDPTLAGKPAVFMVRIKSIREPKLAEMDAAFYENFKVAADDLPALKEALKARMTKGAEQVAKEQLREAVWESFITHYNFEIPKVLLDSEEQRLRKQTLQMQGFNEEEAAKQTLSELTMQALSKRAERSVKASLLVNAYIQANALEASEEEMTAHIAAMAENMSYSADDLKKMIYSNKNMLGEVRFRVLEAKVSEQLMAAAEVTEQRATYDEVMEKRQS